MNTDNDNDVSELQLELAKRIACAVMSYQLGISYQTYWKSYIKNSDTIGDKWIELAKLSEEYLLGNN